MNFESSKCIIILALVILSAEAIITNQTHSNIIFISVYDF